MNDFKINFLFSYIISKVTTQIPVLKFYKRSELLWLDTYFFDYLQKKTADLWIRRFVIFTGFILSEHYIFNKIIKFYTINTHSILNNLVIFENYNVIENLLTILYFFISILIFIFFIQLFLI